MSEQTPDLSLDPSEISFERQRFSNKKVALSAEEIPDAAHTALDEYLDSIRGKDIFGVTMPKVTFEVHVEGSGFYLPDIEALAGLGFEPEGAKSLIASLRKSQVPEHISTLRVATTGMTKEISE